MNKIISIALLLILCFSLPFTINAAEVLQVSNSSSLIIGDQNRNYTIKLACLDVKEENEYSVINFLNSELPRHTKINLRPRGSIEGVLIAQVIKIASEEDIASEIVSKGLGSFSC
tara:strand:- start:120 stop:464 length:345 start_codon:yes stop_codon:yes gene_type:complete